MPDYSKTLKQYLEENPSQKLVDFVKTNNIKTVEELINKLGSTPQNQALWGLIYAEVNRNLGGKYSVDLSGLDFGDHGIDGGNDKFTDFIDDVIDVVEDVGETIVDIIEYVIDSGKLTYNVIKNFLGLIPLLSNILKNLVPALVSFSEMLGVLIVILPAIILIYMTCYLIKRLDKS